MTRPDPIRTDGSSSFALYTMQHRAPEVVRRTADSWAERGEAETAARLRTLADTVAHDGPLALFTTPAPDRAEWAAWFARCGGETWHSAQWWFAEVYLYRLVWEAVGGWAAGKRITDPFLPAKEAALHHEALLPAIEAAARTRLLRYAPIARLHDLLARSLWANRLDLSHDSASLGTEARPEDLLIDQRGAAAAHWEAARAHGGRTAHLIADNVGAELGTDLVLIDHLLHAAASTPGTPDRVTLHVKAHPTFVSDATADDVTALLTHMRTAPQADAPETQALAQRLEQAHEDGRFTVAAHPFWNSPLFGWEMPDDLRAAFAGAALIIAKGDANYRRFVGDADYPPDALFADAVAGGPEPLLVLRTCKSVPLPGIGAARAAALDAEWADAGRENAGGENADAETSRDGSESGGSESGGSESGVYNHWRTSGRYGVIQWSRSRA
jgi:hypothetical protein